MNTPVRNWIIDTLTKSIPVGTFWSDQDTKEKHPFKDLTGMSHKDLLKKWFKITRVKKEEYIHYNENGDDPKFTTCSSFLPIFASSVRNAGGIQKKRNYFTGLDEDYLLRGFQLNVERGWTPAFLGYAIQGGPKPGDFFQLFNKFGQTEHVGVILSIEGDMWSIVAGGGGGRGTKHDGVTRTPLQPRPTNLMGWLDVDIYFEGWHGDSSTKVSALTQPQVSY